MLFTPISEIVFKLSFKLKNWQRGFSISILLSSLCAIESSIVENFQITHQIYKRRSKFQKRNYENEFLYDKINDKFLYEELRKRKLERKNHFLD